jgi:nucleoporin SEH1
MELTRVDAVDDIVNDICFDYYGKRFAVCAMDKRLIVYDAEEVGGDKRWIRTGDIQRAHNDVIWRLAWAHPEFGQVIASCSEDGAVNIWEEQDRVTSSLKGETWQRKAQSNLLLSRRCS